MKTLRKKLISGALAVVSMTTCTAVFAAATDIAGYVTERGGKYVLLSLNDVYVLEGNEMNPGMLEKEVIVTGTVEEKDDIKVIDVYIYDEIEE